MGRNFLKPIQEAANKRIFFGMHQDECILVKMYIICTYVLYFSHLSGANGLKASIFLPTCEGLGVFID